MKQAHGPLLDEGAPAELHALRRGRCVPPPSRRTPYTAQSAAIRPPCAPGSPTSSSQPPRPPLWAEGEPPWQHHARPPGSAGSAHIFKVSLRLGVFMSEKGGSVKCEMLEIEYGLVSQIEVSVSVKYRSGCQKRGSMPK
jgi:hypothetical protein